MNKIISLIGFTLIVNLAACNDKSAANKTTAAPQTSNPIAQPALDATDKAKQVEGIMKKEENTQKEAIDGK
jgi:hypothetical protein